ncbi:MAG: hypothetical protein M3Q07_21660 [Pseudobdellovibrionaceae bacterium]|nr:hypothetical protein [Pseudobdellovibrionaceae bacterium]
MKPWFSFPSLFFMSMGCITEPKKVLLTGVNQTLPRTEVPASLTDMEQRKQEDRKPYAELSIQGPLEKSEVIRTIQLHRKAIDRCYRGTIGDLPPEPSRHRVPPDYEPRENEYSRRNSTTKPDGVVNSTNYSTPHHEPLPVRSGEVVINFTVGTDGKVREVRTGLNDFKGSYMSGCLEKLISEFHFAKRPEESQVRHLTLRFSNETGLLK